MAASPTVAPTDQEQAFHAFHSAEIVGNAFAKQYYMILQQSPELVYRFYQDVSEMSRSSEDGNAMGSTTTMEAINEKIQSYGSLKADIKFVDAQESYNGGVIVLVTGSMINDDDSRRSFTQSFFLAPQDKGYYVLNDIFRYVEDDPAENAGNEQQTGGTAPPAQTQKESPPVLENYVCDQSNGEVDKLVQSGEVPVNVENVEVHAQEKEPVAEVADEYPEGSWVVIESDAKVKDTPKKSYASIVMKDGPATVASHARQQSASQEQDRQVPVAPESVPTALPSSPNAEVVNNNNHPPEGEGCSIHMKNLPYNVKRSVVEEVFLRFGPIKSGGVQILHNHVSKGYCYGFVDYEVASAARSAIEASPITIDGHRVVIEEKRSTLNRGHSLGGNNRGRFPSVRGSGGYRGGSGGRGYDRGESNWNDFGGRGGGRGYQNRGGGYVVRMNRGGGGGSGHISTKDQRVSAQV